MGNIELQLSFTPRERAFVLAYVQALAESGAKYAAWCKQITENNVTYESYEHENDTLYVGPCAVQKVASLTGTLVPSPCVAYVVQVPRITASTYWEPEDVDIVEIANVPSLADAVRALYLHEAEQFLRDIAMCVEYEQDKQDSRDLPVTQEV